MSTEMMTTLLGKGQTGSEILFILDNLTSDKVQGFYQMIRENSEIEPTDQPIDF